MNGLQKKIILKALDSIERGEGVLSEWDAQFIDNMADRPDHYKLSEKQNHQLNRIWDKLENS